MIQISRHVMYGAFDWYGFKITVTGARFHITRGRVGNLSNPLVVTDGRVKGGWFIPETDIELSEDITRVDILSREDKAYIMFRTDDDTERYPDEYTLILALAWKDDAKWYTVVPERDHQYEKDVREQSHYNLRG